MTLTWARLAVWLVCGVGLRSLGLVIASLVRLAIDRKSVLGALQLVQKYAHASGCRQWSRPESWCEPA